MKTFTPLKANRFRRTVLSTFALSVILPLLILIYLLYIYVYPSLDPGRVDHVRDLVTIGLIGMMLVPILGFILLYWWIKTLESFTQEVHEKTVELMPDVSQSNYGNEMLALKHNFNNLYSELQDKMQQLSEYSFDLIDTNIKLSEMATTDVLTSLYNRRYFEERLKEEVHRSARYGYDLALIMVDIDGFKQYNDQYGHQAGDDLLRNIGLIMRSTIRRTDMGFRYGGDEFAVLLPQCEAKDAVFVARKLVRAVNVQKFGGVSEGKSGWISISCGVASGFQTPQSLVANADRCLYKAKNAGKGKVILAKPAGSSPAPVDASKHT